MKYNERLENELASVRAENCELKNNITICIVRMGEYRKQLAAKDTEIATLNSEVERKVSAANFLLSEREKQIVMLRAVMQQAIDGMGGSYALWSHVAKEALTATDNDKDYIKIDEFDRWVAIALAFGTLVILGVTVREWLR